MSTPDPRALAAQALSGIVGDGISLRGAFAAFSTKLSDARDRALLSALMHEGARWWLRFAAALQGLLERPIDEREPQVHALLLLGLVQLEVLRLPEYAAVAATGRGSAGTAQAGVLRTRQCRAAPLAARTRRAQRRAGRRLRHAQRTSTLADRFDRCRLAGADQCHPGRQQCASAVVATREPTACHAGGAGRAFCRRGIPTEAPEALPQALVVAQSLDITRLPGYADGCFSVQDGAAQFAAGLLDARHGMRVLDACAAPGGKAAHILETADVELLALDRDPQRLPRMRENLLRLRLHAEVQAGDAASSETWWNGRQFERILLDAPCSATGIIRRQPDVKLHRRAGDIVTLAEVQQRLLESLWPLLAPGGRLVYATCAVLAAENSRCVDAFIARHTDATVQSVPLDWHAAGPGVQNLPGEGGMDGFFYAIVEKRA